MPGIKQEPISKFYRALRWRGSSAAALAEELGTGDRYIYRIVSGEQRGPRYEQLKGLLREKGWEDLIDLLERVRPPARRWHFGRMVPTNRERAGNE